MLKKALLVNALFSLCSAMIILLGHQWLGQHIPLPNWLWIAMGVGLLCFAGFLKLMTNSRKLTESAAISVVLSDFAWVVVTTIATVAYIATLSGTGIVLIFVVNLIVGALAFFQYFGYRRIVIRPS